MPNQYATDFTLGVHGPDNFARVANSASPTWGAALSKIGGAWAERHNRERTKEANRALAEQQTVKRQGWMQSLGSGATLRELATSDPSVLGDGDFLKFVNATKAPKTFKDVTDDEGRIIGQRGPDGRFYDDPRAAPEPESWETVESPFGRGGIAQRSSTSGKISAYQGPAAQTPERDRRTAKDQFGRPRYLDTGEAAFSDAVMGPGPEPTTPEGPPLKDRLQMVRQLSGDWQKTVRPMQGLLDQSDRMNIGLKMAQGGDMLAGSQAILISFNKLLDRTSVVRESEYARSAAGQSALETMRGFVEKLSAGGAGVTLKELESYRRFGEMVVKRALESTVGPERERISRLVKFAGVDPALIFSGRFAPDAAPKGEQGLARAAVPALPQGAPQAPPRSISPLARALAGGRGAPSSAVPAAAALGGAPIASPAPSGQEPQAASEMSAGDRHRIEMYARLPKDALQRQAEDMRDNPTAYSDAEKHAAGLAWRRVFEGR